jgi:hypothetical protein
VLIVCNGMIRSGSTLQYNLVCSLVEKMGVGVGNGSIHPSRWEEFQQQFEDWAKADTIHVIKSHDLIPRQAEMAASGQLLTCYIYRDLKEVAVSTQRMFSWARDRDALLDILDRAIATYFEIENMENKIWQKYEDVVTDLELAVQTLAEGIGLNPTQEIISTIARQWSIDNVKQKMKRFERFKVFREISYFIRDKIGIKNTNIGRFMRQMKVPDYMLFNVDSQSLLLSEHISKESREVEREANTLDLELANIITERYRDWFLNAGYQNSISYVEQKSM